MKNIINMKNIIIILLSFALLMNLVSVSQNSAVYQTNTTSINDVNSLFTTSSLNGKVAIIQDVSPGSYPGKELKDILETHALTYDYYKSNDITQIDFTLYDKVILSGNQPTGFASNITAVEILLLENYVSEGGYVLIMPDNDSFGPLPGGGTYSTLLSETIENVNSNHPVLNKPNVINVTDLQSLGPSTAGYVFSIPGNPNFILENGAMASVMYEISYGLGNIMVSTLPLERIHGTDVSLLFENVVLFAPLLNDQEDPTLSSPDDANFEVGSLGNFINWIPIDANPDSYTITQNGIQVEQGTWTNDSEISYSVDGLSIGIYSFEITIKDLGGNLASDQVIITISDSIPPSLTSPNNVTYEFGSTGNSITWVATDSSPANYSVYIENQLVNNGSWISGQSIIQDIDGLSVGNFTVVLIVEDTSGFDFDNQILVSVIDTTAPVGTNIEDLEFKMGSENNFLNWTITDLLPNKYILTKNDSIVAEGEWSSNKNITFELEGLDVGHYLFALEANDTSGNEFRDEVQVTILPNDFYISSPIDLFYLEGTTGHSITWITDSPLPWYFVITRNNEVIKNETWTYFIIKIKVDGLKPGDHNFTLELHDKNDSILFDSVMTRVFPSLVVSNLPNTQNTDWVDRIYDIDNRVLIGGAAAITVFGGFSFYKRRK